MHVFVTSDLGAEVGLASLANAMFRSFQSQLLDGKVGVIVLPYTQIQTPGLLKEKVEALLGERQLMSLTLFGDYWPVEEFNFIFKHTAGVWICYFDGTAMTGDRKVETTPTKFLFERINTIAEQYAAGIHNSFSPEFCPTALTLLDQRCCGKDSAKTQKLISGLMNYNGFQGSLEERFFTFFTEVPVNPPLEKAVLSVGIAAVLGQIDLVANRVKENSYVQRLLQGWDCAVGTASELVNLTHDELHRQYPDAHITCVLKMWVKTEPQIAHSLRSWHPGINVELLVKPFGGGGSPEAAGVRFPWDLHFPYSGVEFNQAMT